MFDLMLRHTRPLWALAALGLLLAGCGSGSSPTASEPTGELSPADGSGAESREDSDLTIAPGEPNPSTPATDVEGLVTRFQELGLEASYQGQSLEQSFFFPAPHLVTVDGEDVRVYVYDDIEALREDAAKISVDGSTLGNTSVHWIAPPRFYARGTFLVLYVGVNERIVRVLDSTLGAPFAGAGATKDVDPVDPGDDAYRFDGPALIVAGTDEELERLAPYVTDELPADELRAIDLTEYFVVAVFRGALPTAGYGIEIETVDVDADGQVVVEVSLDDPGTDELVAQVVTYPLDVKAIRRGDLPADADLWTARTADGRQLATFGSTGPIPVEPDGGIGTTPDGGDLIVSDPLPVEPDGGTGATPDDGDEVIVSDPIPVEPDGGTGATPGDEPFRLADIRGTITEVERYEDNAGGALVRLLVEGDGTDDTLYDIAWVAILESTAISFDGETFAPPSVTDLAPGRRVEIRFTGPVAESYPVQAVAESVMIFE